MVVVISVMGLRLDAGRLVLEDVVARACRRNECAESEARLLCQAGGVITRRSDPPRVAVLCVLVVGAVMYAVKSGEDGWLDLIRFGVGAVAGCFVGIGLRRLDDGLTTRVAPTEAERLADIARRLAPIVGVAFAVIVVGAGGFPGSASIWLSGAFAGMLVTVGLLYPLPQFRSGRG